MWVRLPHRPPNQKAFAKASSGESFRILFIIEIFGTGAVHPKRSHVCTFKAVKVFFKKDNYETGNNNTKRMQEDRN